MTALRANLMPSIFFKKCPTSWTLTTRCDRKLVRIGFLPWGGTANTIALLRVP